MPRTSKKQSSRKRSESEVDRGLLKALNHPDRFEALHILNRRVASPTEVAREMQLPVNHIAYHVRKLEDYGCIELVRTEPRRGAVEHFYRATTKVYFKDKEWADIPASVRASMIGKQIARTGQEVGDALQAGTFEARGDRHATYFPLDVDEQGWGEVMDILNDALERVTEVQAEAANRLADSEQEPISLLVSMLGFERASA